MPGLLLVNPNTSAGVSGLLQQHMRLALGDAAAVHTLTARFGAPYIACEASYAVAQHAVLDAWAVAQAQGLAPSAVLIGCFGDPGLFALREGAGVPVGGLAEAAFAAAARHGRFAVVTGGERWKPMLQRLAQALGRGERLAGVHTVTPSGAELLADPQGARALLAQACREAAERFRADAVVLGGAALAGMAADIAPQVLVPLVDSVQAGAEWARAAVAQPLAQDAPAGFGVPWHNVSPELAALG
ncbi:aspartate/glutamate racemase family protein [Xenophilus azovorans]|uniref:aspartate/glutamate racemase family protein n=1 Tax=Xenophilus azovorans TaxID=151755 RepID=UPI00056E2E2A|nr:aspartate/glutamate racemase family protein [Xenophilus azovorans]